MTTPSRTTPLPTPPATTAEPVQTATIETPDAATLYRILRLRVDVFVVEQACAYPELDGLDLNPSTQHCWIASADGTVLGYLRVLHGPGGGSRIGRVVTAGSARGRGIAARLLHHGLGLAGRPVRIDAQAHLSQWYAGFGLVVCGPAFTEDGIAHVPMALGLAARPAAGPVPEAISRARGGSSIPAGWS